MRRVRRVLMVTAGMAVPMVLQAQSGPLDREAATATWLEVLRPSIKDNTTGVGMWLAHLGFRHRFGGGITLVAEVPYSTYSDDFGGSASGLGNVLVGASTGSAAGTSVLLAARLPTAADDSPALADAAVDFDRFEAYVPDVLTVLVSGSSRLGPPRGLAARLFGGVDVLFPTGDNSGDPEAFADYGFAVLYTMDQVELSAAPAGRWLFTESGSFNDRSAHQITFSGTFRGSRVRPTLYLRLPFDEGLKQDLKLVLGVGAVVALH